jgi:hypothetical protein
MCVCVYFVVDRENGLLINCHTAIMRFGAILSGLTKQYYYIAYIISEQNLIILYLHTLRSIFRTSSILEN